MPFIHVRTTKPVTKAQEEALVRHFGSAMPLIGKSEAWLMSGVESNCHLYFRGSDEKDLCFVTVAVFGHVTEEKAAKLTTSITDAIHAHLSVDPDCIYIQYQEAATWGWNGSNF